MQFTGKIEEIGALQQGTTERGPWSSREIVLRNQDYEYDEVLVCKLSGERAQNFSFRSGEEVKVQLGFRARKSKDGRWFNEIRCFKIESFPLGGSGEGGWNA